jgi:hypothetical protein
MDKKTIIIILSLLLAVAVLYIGYDTFMKYENNKMIVAYQQGAIDAQNQIYGSIIQQLNTQGFFIFNAPTSKNNTVALKLGILPETKTSEESSP